MTAIALETRSEARSGTWLFAMAAFMGAALVFMVEPMAARFVLPTLGGSPAVWNAAMAFFQAALLAGYGYAHLLQRVPSLKAQAIIHFALLAAAALVLPLRMSTALGPPGDVPALWLFGVFALSLGAPFVVLSATAPLLQAWFSRIQTGHEGGKTPYALYAASNLGSLLALIAYPLIVEPTSALRNQAMGWTVGYGLFALVIVLVGVRTWRAKAASVATPAALAPGSKVTWRERVTWTALAALPSSLMLGVTTHISTDVASAPFLWVAPLALYLLTFVVAFQDRPAISQAQGLRWQAPAVILVSVVMSMAASNYLVTLAVHLATFFLCALVCHQAMVARRPEPEHLTEFYLLMSLGGVIGGGFNAFLAPLLFNAVAEYPLALALCCLVRPWGKGPLSKLDMAALVTGLASVAFLYLVRGTEHLAWLGLFALIPFALAAFKLNGRGLAFGAIIAAMLAQGFFARDAGRTVIHQTRSFFGVHRVMVQDVPELGGASHLLSHGTTLHGAEPLSEQGRCRPGAYYARTSAIGQSFAVLQAQRPALNVGVVGLGTGSVAAYMRPTDRVRFYEIDPAVARIATDPRYFRFISDCAQGPVDITLGDARLNLAVPGPAYDVIELDAFSSDAIPTHLLTVEALQLYLSRLAPDGVLVMHISNRNLSLKEPTAAAARRLGLVALYQHSRPPSGTNRLVENSTEVMLIARNAEALAPFARDPRWRPVDPGSTAPWTDDYTNVAGALWRHLTHPN